jgi:transposase-like protein
MGLGLSDISRTAQPTRTGARKKWREMLKQWVVQCPECDEVRLVVGAHENDRYVCKDCGHRFVIKLSVATNDTATL